MEHVATLEVTRVEEVQEPQVQELSTEMLGLVGGGIIVAVL